MVKALRQAIIVLGMHRSGTSALAGALGILGMRLPPDLLPPMIDNPKGYFESKQIVAIHDRLLKAAGASWFSIESLPEDWFKTAAASAFVDELVAALRQDFGDAGTFVVKDPRMCRLVPLWRRVLGKVGAQARFAIALRNPLEVARSLEKRNDLPLAHGCLLWLRHVLEAERETRGSRRVFVHYHDLLSDPARMAERVASQLTEKTLVPNKEKEQEISSLIDSDLRHHVAKPEDIHLPDAFYPWLWDAYEACGALVERPAGKEPQRRLDRVGAMFDRAAASFAPLLVTIETVLAKRDEKISALYQTLEQLNGQLVNLSQATVEHNEKIVSLGQAVAERDGQIVNLSQAAAEHNEKIVSLGQSLAESDRQITSLGQAVAERDGQIVSLDQSLTVNDRQITSLGQAVAERDRQIVSLGNAVAERDGQIVSLGQAVAERDRNITAQASQLDEIFRSTVWRLLAPVRWYGRLRRGGGGSVEPRDKPGLSAQPSIPNVRDGHRFRCSLVIPTKNGGDLFKSVVHGLQTQTCWKNVEFIVVDSGSTDDTVSVALSAGAIVRTIPPKEFNHGATRDYAISLASNEYVVLMVQDAVPYDDLLIERLLSALSEEGVAGAYARQIPRSTASVIVKRNLNSWHTGELKRKVKVMKSLDWYEKLSPAEKLDICNFDNVCSAINKRVWKEERFGRTDFGEDIEWSLRVLKRKFKIIYEPSAAVVHSHERSLIYEYKRTYICHRLLYRQYGLKMVSSFREFLREWRGQSVSDILYVTRTEKDNTKKLRALLMVPAINLVTAFGLYRAVKDETFGIKKKVKGV
jgi:glycosyltransferase involved in cell wall biosynthesis